MSSTRNEELHRVLRRPVANAYALSTLVEFEPLVDSTSIVFMKQMDERFVKTVQECNLSRWLQMYAFDIMYDISICSSPKLYLIYKIAEKLLSANDLAS